MLFVFQPPVVPTSSAVKPRLFPFDVEALLVECALNTVKSIVACPKNNLKYLAMVADIAGF